MIEHKPGKNLKVGIFIPTMNRSEFIIRQLKYYASVNCPHTIYIGDSSNQEHLSKTKKTIDGLSNKIKVIHKHVPNLNDREASLYLLSIVEESYVCFSGDDDYQIPNSLSKCAEFLENHPDYSSASGYAVSFRLKSHGTYGELSRLADYPRRNIEFPTAAERTVDFMTNYYVPVFSVNRTNRMQKNWGGVNEIKDKSFGSEIIPCALSIIDGKTATLECLGFVRQIHDSHYGLPNTYDWVTNPYWHSSYEAFENMVSEGISQKDAIPLEDAARITKQAFWSYLQKWLSKEYGLRYADQKNNGFYRKFMISVRSKIVKMFPFLKYIYRIKIKPLFTGRRELNYELLRPNSKYYNDFRPVMDSFTGKFS